VNTILQVAERVLIKGWAHDDEAKRLAHTVRRLHAGIEQHMALYGDRFVGDEYEDLSSLLERS
jgi:hypothetical protein